MATAARNMATGSQELSSSGADIGAAEEIPDAVLPDIIPEAVAAPEAVAEAVH